MMSETRAEIDDRRKSDHGCIRRRGKPHGLAVPATRSNLPVAASRAREALSSHSTVSLPPPVSLSASWDVPVLACPEVVTEKQKWRRPGSITPWRTTETPRCDVCQQRASRYFQILGKTIHPHCFKCVACSSIIDPAHPKFFAYTREKQPLHWSCYTQLYGIKCVVCKQSITLTPDGKMIFAKHPFFDSERMCQSHAVLPHRRCTGCQRYEPTTGPGFAELGDADRCVCDSCYRTVVTDVEDVRPLWERVIDFFEDYLRLPVWPGMRDIPVLLVGIGALEDHRQNAAPGGAANEITRGMCLLRHEETKQRSVKDALPPYERDTTRQDNGGNRCEFIVDAILLLSGLPADLASSVLAHEATHAWFKLHPEFSADASLPLQVEEGCCQLVAQLFLTHGLQRASTEGHGDGPSDEKLREYFRFCIEADKSNIHGTGYRMAKRAYAERGIEAILNHAIHYQGFPTTSAFMGPHEEQKLPEEECSDDSYPCVEPDARRKGLWDERHMEEPGSSDSGSGIGEIRENYSRCRKVVVPQHLSKTTESVAFELNSINEADDLSVARQTGSSAGSTTSNIGTTKRPRRAGRGRITSVHEEDDAMRNSGSSEQGVPFVESNDRLIGLAAQLTFTPSDGKTSGEKSDVGVGWIRVPGRSATDERQAGRRRRPDDGAGVATNPGLSFHPNPEEPRNRLDNGVIKDSQMASTRMQKVKDTSIGFGKVRRTDRGEGNRNDETELLSLRPAPEKSVPRTIAPSGSSPASTAALSPSQLPQTLDWKHPTPRAQGGSIGYDSALGRYVMTGRGNDYRNEDLTPPPPDATHRGPHSRDNYLVRSVRVMGDAGTNVVSVARLGPEQTLPPSRTKRAGTRKKGTRRAKKRGDKTSESSVVEQELPNGVKTAAAKTVDTSNHGPLPFSASASRTAQPSMIAPHTGENLNLLGASSALIPEGSAIRDENVEQPENGVPPLATRKQSDKDCRSKRESDAIEVGRHVMQRVIESVPEPLQISAAYVKYCTNEFAKDRLLGEGAFGEVYLGIDKVLRRKFAVKRIQAKLFADGDKGALHRAKTALRRELEALKHFRHPNISRLYAFCLSDSPCELQFLVFDLAARGSLDKLLGDVHGRRQLHWTTRIKIAYDIATAVRFLHSGVSGQICFHGDIKSANVCLKKDFTALLIDCGLLKMVPTADCQMTMSILGSTKSRIRGTPGYICPTYGENFLFGQQQQTFGSANDVYSLGVVFTELLTGKLQCSKIDGKDINLFQLYSRDGNCKRKLAGDADPLAGEWERKHRDNFAELAVKCIGKAPESRPSIQQIESEVSFLYSSSKPWSRTEKNKLTFLFADPLVWMDEAETIHPVSPRLDFGQERDLLSLCVRKSNKDIKLSFHPATYAGLQKLANARCGCLHISGHGVPDGRGNSYLMFEDGFGGAHCISTEQLRSLFHHPEPFLFVFVSACHSESFGKALADAGVRHVLCCERNSQLKDAAAVELTSIFYEAVAEGYTVKVAFELGKRAVSVGYSEDESKKFILLPEDVDHDEPLFDAKEIEWDEGCKTKQLIPKPPVDFVGREVFMHNVLYALLSRKRLITLVGQSGIGRSSVASAISHYINDRIGTVPHINSIFYVQRNMSSCDLHDSFLIPLRAQLKTKENNGSKMALEDGAIEYLDASQALIVFDGADGLEESLLRFLSVLFQKTQKVSVLVTAGKPTRLMSSSVREECFFVEPLTKRVATRLFGRACPLSDTGAKRLVLEKAVLSRISSHPGGDTTDEIWSVVKTIVEGIPCMIVEAAQTLSKGTYYNLIKAA